MSLTHASRNATLLLSLACCTALWALVACHEGDSHTPSETARERTHFALENTAAPSSLPTNVGNAPPALTLEANPLLATQRTFDLRQGLARATVLPLQADVTIDKQGHLQIHPTPAVDLQGRERLRSWTYHLAFDSIGRQHSARAPGNARAAGLTQQRWITHYEGGLALIYAHLPEGLEQLITLDTPPPGDGPLVITFKSSPETEHKTISPEHISVWVGGRERLQWQKLIVYDAAGTILPAKMEGQGDTLRYTIDDSLARYPITVDPLATSPSWSSSGANAAGYHGISLVNAGDVNNDGYQDVLVGEPGYTNGQTNEGRILVFHGSATGLQATAARAIESNQANAWFGNKVVALGDIDNDGFSDIAVAAPYFTSVAPSDGRVTVYRGSSSGILATPAWTGVGEGGTFGQSMAVGDFNCDGRLDLAVGAFMFNAFRGRVYLYNGLATSPYFSATPQIIERAIAGERFGAALAAGNFSGSAGATGGRSCSDLAVSAPLSAGTPGNSTGRVLVYAGTETGLDLSNPWNQEGIRASEQFGTELLVGDINDDGYDDLLVGAPFHSSLATRTREGRIALFLGSSAGLVLHTWQQLGGAAEAAMGRGMALGDFNGDGYLDLLAGKPFYSTTTPGFGSLHLFMGLSSGLTPDAIWNLTAAEINSAFGYTVAAADVNGDGRADAIAGAYFGDGITIDSGTAYQYLAVPSCWQIGACLINNQCHPEGTINPANSCEACNPDLAVANWSVRPIGSACDRLFCMVDETCDAMGFCGGGVPRDCSSAITDCTTSAVCSEFNRRCVPTNPVADGSPCSDNNACTSGDQCLGGNCVGTPQDCDHFADQCNIAACDTVTGDCFADPVANNTPCDDNDACTLNNTCQEGLCAGIPRVCNDSNPCTTDSCDPVTGCVFPPLPDNTQCAAPSCSPDGSAAYAAATCQAALCTPPMPQPCAPFTCSGGVCLTACTQDSECQTGWCNTLGQCTATNRPPVADAGPDQTVALSARVVLDGTRSQDPDGHPITAQWIQVAGPSVTLDGAQTLVATFNAPDTITNLGFELRVSDGDIVRSDTTAVFVTDTANNRPQANVIVPAFASPGSTISLQGHQSSDLDGDPLTYNWSLVSGMPAAVVIGRTEIVAAAYIPPSAPPGTEYTFRLIVNDGKANSDPRFGLVTVRAPLQPPVIVRPAEGERLGDIQPTFFGTAAGAAGGQVEVYRSPDLTLVCVANVTQAAAWECRSDLNLTEGEHRIYAVAIDQSANRSEPSPLRNFVVDTSIPRTPTLLAPVALSVLPAGPVNAIGESSALVNISVYLQSEPADLLLCTTATDASGNFNCPLGRLEDGIYTLYAIATNTFGVTSSQSIPVTFFIDVDGDTDNDGMPDYWERLHGFDPLDAADAAGDADNDTLTNLAEFRAGTNPRDADSDDDGVCDNLELAWNQDSDGDGAVNAMDVDSDNDGIFDAVEMGLTEPCGSATDNRRRTFRPDADPSTTTSMILADTDGDGVRDGAEDPNHNGRIDAGEYDPNDGITPNNAPGLEDSDNDGITDREEVYFRTNPIDADSDDDGIRDGFEPNWSVDGDGDGLINALDPDSDNDGLADGTEFGVASATNATDLARGRYKPDADPATTTVIFLADSDGDGIRDGAEDFNLNGRVDAGESDPNDPYTDPNHLRFTDSDGDGLTDAEEDHLQSLFGPGTPQLRSDADSDDDGIMDGLEANWWDDHDGDGRPNMLDHDSDNDCVFDGTERGLTAPHADTDLGQGNFLADADPSTTTWAVNNDTDGDTFTEDEEDLNCNGRVDRSLGETDPNDPNDPPVECRQHADCPGGFCVDLQCVYTEDPLEPPVETDLESLEEDLPTLALMGGGCTCQISDKRHSFPVGALLLTLGLGLMLLARRRRPC